MALAHMREKQKTFAWVVAGLIVPLFVLSMVVSPSGNPDGGGRDVPVLVIDNDTITASEYSEFYHMMRMQNPYEFMDRFSGGFLNLNNPRTAGVVGRLMLQVRDAEKAGLQVSDGEVGTVIRKRFGKEFTDTKTKAFKEQEFKNYLKNAMRTDLATFKKAIRTNLLLAKFRELISARSLVSPVEGYSEWARGKAKLSYDLLEVKSADYREAAKKATPEMDTAVAVYMATHKAKDRSFFKPGTFAVEYILAPFAKMAPGTISDKDIADYFEKNKKDFGEKKLADVKKEIRGKIETERRENAAQSIINDVSDILTGLTAKDDVVSLKALMTQAELKRKQELGLLQTGTSGQKELTVDELLALPVFKDSDDLKNALTALDSNANAASRDALVKQLQENFDLRDSRSRKNKQSAAGAFKFRILSYTAGVLKDPKQDKAFRQELVEKVIDNKARELAKKAVQDMAAKVMDGKTDGIKLESKTTSLRSAPTALRSNITIDEPTPVEDTAEGFRIYFLRGRKIPSYAEFSEEPQETRNAYASMAKGKIRWGDRSNYFAQQGGERKLQWEAINSARIKVLLGADE